TPSLAQVYGPSDERRPRGRVLRSQDRKTRPPPRERTGGANTPPAMSECRTPSRDAPARSNTVSSTPLRFPVKEKPVRPARFSCPAPGPQVTTPAHHHRQSPPLDDDRLVRRREPLAVDHFGFRADDVLPALHVLVDLALHPVGEQPAPEDAGLGFAPHDS